MIKCFVCSVALCVAEIWTLIKADRIQLEVLEVWIRWDELERQCNKCVLL